jgi:hypothetical protein
MAGFLYYIGGLEDEVDAAALRARLTSAGLGYAFPDTRIERVGCAMGPDGGRGLVVARSGMGVDVGYYPLAGQQWHKSVKAPAAWVGAAAGKRTVADDVVGVGVYASGLDIGPHDLLRDDAVGGCAVELGDGQQWLVPVVHACLDGQWQPTALPRRSRLNAQGRWELGDVLPRYEAIDRVAREWLAKRSEAITRSADAERGGGTVTIEVDDVHVGAVELLAANYRIGSVEVAMLGLLDGCWQRVLDAAIEWEVFAGWVKKKAASEPVNVDVDGG